ncbi:MAG: type II toxin-antitoxin system RelE/ParE family toxin [Proteobacteria bacterium]|nr:type II toxin-antitoxin system RelE/ParE family toxin [Pseudomonadota bacterium]
MNLFWTETAKEDLRAIKYYISQDNPAAAKQWIERLKATVFFLRKALNPEYCKPVELCASGKHA